MSFRSKDEKRNGSKSSDADLAMLGLMVQEIIEKTVVNQASKQIYENVMPEVQQKILDTFGPLPERIEIVQGPETREVTGIFHEKFPDVLKLVSLGIPVYLSGDAGTGKNVICQQVAESLGLEFYFTNAVTQEHKITGFIDAGGRYHETQFYKAFKDGGLFFLDELDASIPEVLVILNAAIANGYFDFPIGKITAHKDFRVIAAGNTFGTGADHVYSGRYCLDGASLDRFCTIQVSYSNKIEKAITDNDTDLLTFCYKFRELVRQSGMKCLFSYRSLGAIYKLRHSMPLPDVLRICLVKGMDKDDLILLQKNMKNMPQDNKYIKAFLEL